VTLAEMEAAIVRGHSDKDLARHALADNRQGPGDFADYLIGWRNREAGCSETLTFDQALKRNDLFRLV